MLQTGELLDGYRVIRLIGSAGGAVWLCESQALRDLRMSQFILVFDAYLIDKEFDLGRAWVHLFNCIHDKLAQGTR